MPLKSYDTTDSHKKSITSPAIESARAQHDKAETARQEESRRLERELWPELRFLDAYVEGRSKNPPKGDWITEITDVSIGQDRASSTGEAEPAYPEVPTYPNTRRIATAEMVQKFLLSRRGTIAGESLTSYRHTLSIFAKYCPTLPLTPEELETYFARFTERRSAASAYSPIKQLYEFANARYDVPNAMKSVKRARFKEKEPYAFTSEEARVVLNACRNDRELGLIHLYLGHGFRLEEACRVNVGDILDSQINVRGKERYEYLPLLPETRDLLLGLANGRKPAEPLFTSFKGRRLCHKETYNIVKAILKRAGVTEGKDGQRIATHTLRKTFATLATHAGCNDRLVKRLLRHKTADITSLYVSMPMESLRANLERYSPIRLLNGQPKEELHKIFSCSI